MAVLQRKINYPAVPPGNVAMDPTMAQLEYLALHCREDEKRQACAINGWDTYDGLAHARNLVRQRGAIVVGFDSGGVPTAAGGFTQDPTVDGVWRGWAVGTQAGWDSNWRSITKAAKAVIRGLMESSAHRLEIECIGSRVEAQEWYVLALGFQYEGRRRGFTEYGEDLYLYSLTSADWQQLEERHNGR